MRVKDLIWDYIRPVLGDCPELIDAILNVSNSEKDLYAAFKAAYVSLVTETGILTDSDATSLTTALNTQKYSVPSNYIRNNPNTNLLYDTTKTRLEGPITQERLNMLKGDTWEADTGTPVNWFMTDKNLKIGLYPIPNSGAASKTLYLNDYVRFPIVPLTIHNCEQPWTAKSNVTATVDADYRFDGDYSSKLLVAAGFTTGLLATYDLPSAIDMSDYSQVGLWVYSDLAIASGVLQLTLDNTAACASPLETINLPAIPANIWTYIEVDLAAASSDTAILSVGLNAASDPGEPTLYVDFIHATKEPEIEESLQYQLIPRILQIMGKGEG